MNINNVNIILGLTTKNSKQKVILYVVSHESKTCATIYEVVVIGLE